jgi:hypothetical protein
VTDQVITFHYLSYQVLSGYIRLSPNSQQRKVKSSDKKSDFKASGIFPLWDGLNPSTSDCSLIRGGASFRIDPISSDWRWENDMSSLVVLMFCTGTFPDCWRFIEVLTSSFAQVFVEAGNLRFNRQPPTPKMHYPSCNSSWFSWFLYVFCHEHPPFIIGISLLSVSWALGMSPGAFTFDVGADGFIRGEANGANGPGNEKVPARWIWIHGVFSCFFFPNLDPVDPVGPSIFPSLCGWNPWIFPAFSQVFGWNPWVFAHFSGHQPARPGPASTARQGCCAVHLAAENDGERAAGERSLAVLLGSCANQAPWPRLPRLGSDWSSTIPYK